jgi:hypothetical protein
VAQLFPGVDPAIAAKATFIPHCHYLVARIGSVRLTATSTV